MKKCVQCNTPIERGETKCSYCGLEVARGEAQRRLSRGSGSPHSGGVRGNGLQIAVKVLLIIVNVLVALGLVSGISLFSTVFSIEVDAALEAQLSRLLWTTILCFVQLAVNIPFTVHYFRTINSGSNVGLAFKICTLFLVNRIAGILMLCDTSN